MRGAAARTRGQNRTKTKSLPLVGGALINTFSTVNVLVHPRINYTCTTGGVANLVGLLFRNVNVFLYNFNVIYKC